MLIFAAGQLARFEQIPQPTVLADQLLSTEIHRAFNRRAFGKRGRKLIACRAIRERTRRDRNAQPIGRHIEQAPNGMPIEHDRDGCAHGTAVTIRLGKHFERVALADDCRFAFGLARRGWQRPGADR